MTTENPEERGSFDLGSISLVVPVFNEERRLQQNADALIGFIEKQAPGSQLIIVDDGSTDNTVQVADAVEAESSRVAFLAQPHLGKGAAVQVGLRSAVTSLAGYADVDLSTPLHEIARLFRIAASTNALVIGSRDNPDTVIGTHQTRRREILGKLFNLWVRGTITPGIKDTQCGAKFARREVWESILHTTEEEGFAWDAEVVAQAIRQGLGVVEVGIQWSHDPMTRVRVWRDGVSMARAVPRIARRLAIDRQRSRRTSIRSEP